MSSLVTTLAMFPAVPYKDLRHFRRKAIRRLQRPGSNPEKCGLCRRTEDVEIWRQDDSAWYRGLVNCGQVWACPVCAYRIATQRAKEVLAVIEGHRKAGGAVYLVTATMPHDYGDHLKPMRKTVATAWRTTTAGRAWQDMKTTIAIDGQVRALEVTHGPNGWHPHLHVLFFTRRFLTEAEMASLSDFLYERWSDAISAAGYRRPSREHGLCVSHGEDAGQYVTKITKQGLAQEISRSDSKQGSVGHRSILQIIDDADESLIREWLRDMWGAKQLTWSHGIRKRYLLAEQLDFDLCQDPGHPLGERVGVICGWTWDRLIRFDPSLSWRLLKAAEVDGRAGAWALLEEADRAWRDTS